MMGKWFQVLAQSAIRSYQIFLSPFLGGHCRFQPSCSQYADEAVAQHGVFKGMAKTAARLLKCHPFHPGGYDPVSK